ncbi:hypothetical protein BDY19DRAFT_543885 [Irpex rosettiformis]|uniref:Uncharacterized protein n=1 Tax=Irpex rosettiformis TaxID=378272 RepID=A0ACB8TQY3_9APHY|nr:hypothetical protein BDY19DRAFT_543885 [Irpex rosettiformis]
MDPFYELYTQLGRFILISAFRLLSLAGTVLTVIGVVAYLVAFLYSVRVSCGSLIEAHQPIILWTVYITRKLATSPYHYSSNGLNELVNGNTISPRFPEGHYPQRDFAAKYDLGVEPGSGSNGFVLQARRRRDGLEVALKFVLKRNSAKYWEQHPVYGPVPLDVIAMDRARHENTVALLDVFSDDRYLYIVSVFARFCRSSEPHSQVQELHGTLSYPQGEEDK